MIRKTIYYILSFLLGAMILNFLSVVQKMIIGAPLALTGFLIPTLFGSIAGVVIAWKNAKLKEKIELAKQIEESLRESKFELLIRDRINAIFLTAPDEEMYNEVLKIVLEAVKSEYGILGYINNYGAWVCPTMTKVDWDKCIIPDQSTRFPHEQRTGLWGKAMHEKKVIFSNSPFVVPSGHLPVSRAMVAPIIYKESLIGNILVGNKNSAYDERDATLLKNISDKIATVLHSRLKLEAQEKQSKELDAQLFQTQKVEAIGRLTGGIAHDLNNLLSPILGYGELLLFDGQVNDSQRERLKQIIKAGNGARDLVQRLLAFSRKQVLDYKPLDLNVILSEFLKLLRRTIPENIEIKLIQSSSIPNIMADKGQIEQVIMNLAVNATDAMPHGGELVIETALTTIDEKAAVHHPDILPGTYLLMRVSDSGCGMDDNTCSQIFEPFFTTKGEKGTGLGLSTVYGIVKQHGGSISAKSRPNKGTSFSIFIPATEKSQVVEKERISVAADISGSETILLVEDNPLVRKSTCDLLKRMGYTVIVEENANDALSTLVSHQNTIDLILTDVIMPGMDGRQLFKAAVGKKPGIKVLYMSGYADSVIVHHGVLEQGMQFIQKPFTAEALGKKIKSALKQV